MKHEMPASRPELIFDPETGTWGILIDSVEMVRDIDLREAFELREKMRLAAGGGPAPPTPAGDKEES